MCGALVAVIFLVYIGRLGQWQLLEGETYAEEAVVSSSFIKLTGARGEILDRNGEVLAGNRPVYNIVYSRLSEDAQARNETILSVVQLLESVGVAWIDRLPIVIGAGGEYAFDSARQSEIETMKSADMLDLPADADAAACMAALVERYEIDNTTDKADVRRIASVRYNMERSAFSRTNPYVIAEDVAIETVEIVSERASDTTATTARSRRTSSARSARFPRSSTPRRRRRATRIPPRTFPAIPIRIRSGRAASSRFSNRRCAGRTARRPSRPIRPARSSPRP